MKTLLTNLQLYCQLMVVVMLTACNDIGDPASEGKITLNAPEIRAAVSEMALTSGSDHQRLIESLEALEQSVTRFTKNANEAQLADAQQRWIEAHQLFALASVFFLVPEGTSMQKHLFNVDAWPILPGFLDAMPDYPDSGIINDVTLPITDGSLRQQHGITDIEEVSLGYHALELFLFSKELTDYTNTSEPSQRRLEAINILADLLVQDVRSLIAQQRTLVKNLQDRNEEAILSTMLTTLLGNIRRSFEEVNLASDNYHGHSHLSRQSWPTVHHRMTGLKLMVNEPMNLSSLMLALDQETGTQFIQNFEQLTSDVTSQLQSEDENPEIALRISVLTHDLETLISQSRNVLVSETASF